MRKQVKLSDLEIGDKFSLYSSTTNNHTKVNCTGLNLDYCHRNLCCFGLIYNTVIAIRGDKLVYIDAPDLTFKDLNIGDNFIYNDAKYIKMKTEESGIFLAIDLNLNTCYYMNNNSIVIKLIKEKL